MSQNSDILSVTLFFSALAHAVIILGVSFQIPDLAKRNSNDNNLDVVLLNSNNDLADDRADAISVNDNLGGGLFEQDATTPELYKTVNPQPIESVTFNAASQPETTSKTDDFISATQGDVALAINKQQTDRVQTSVVTQGNDIVSTKSQRQLERERLIAKIKKEQQDYQKRPRKVFLTPSTKSSPAAKYLLGWIKKVQKEGNSIYGREIKRLGLVGRVIISTEINPNGTVARVAVLEPSRHKILNDYAKRIIRAASPFTPFPDEEYFEQFRSQDLLVITRTFEFDARSGFRNETF